MATKFEYRITADDIPIKTSNEESKLWATLVVTQREFLVAAAKLRVSQICPLHNTPPVS